MESESRHINSELLRQNSVIEAPAVEALLDNSRAQEVWPERIVADTEFLEQVDERKELISSLNEIANCIPLPTVSIEDAIAGGQLTEPQAERLYTSLSRLLENADYRRVLLYLPLEFLPRASWQPREEGLQNAMNRFKEAYLEIWSGLLTTHDVRANFVDGDVIEVEQRGDGLPRVVKAAHLIPTLVQKGLVNADEVVQLLEQSDDPVLKRSIADTFSVLMELNLVDEEEIDRLGRSHDAAVADAARLVERGVMEREERELHPLTFSAVEARLQQADADFNALEQGDATDRRWEWLRSLEIQRVVGELSGQVKDAILSQSLGVEEMVDFLSEGTVGHSGEVAVEGMRKAIEFTAATDSATAQELFQHYSKTLEVALQATNPPTRQAAIRTFRRLYGLGIVDDSALEQRAISKPNLVGPMSENIKEMKPELDEKVDAILTERKQSGLDSVIYPIVILYGSRIKGYGEAGSDTDAAIFVRPGTPISGLVRIKESFPEATQFWLEENERGHLSVRNFDLPTEPIGESFWISILFGGAWSGDPAVVTDVRERLLTPYFYETDEEIYGRNLRDICLEEMEKDALQYRLMHKGYERFAPTYGGLPEASSQRVDGQSMFWDSGYRRVATQIYANRVFLPKLSLPTANEQF